MACILFITVIQACATTTENYALDNVALNSKIVVISDIDSVFRYSRIGTTVFNNKNIATSVQDWDINNYSQNRISESLKNYYTIVDNPEISSHIIIPKPDPFGGSGEFYPLKDENGLKYLQENGVDYLISITSKSYPDEYIGTDKWIDGYGIHQRTRPSLESVLYSQIDVTLFEVSSGKFVASNINFKNSERDYIWIKSKRINLSDDLTSESYLKQIANKYKSDIFELLNSQLDRSLSFMGFQVTVPVK